MDIYEVVEGHLTNVSYDGKGSFDCSCDHLKSLKGCPEEVNGGFYCYTNHLTTLEGCPKIVNGEFDCAVNSLTTLEGCPKKVKGDFNCGHNNLTSLKGCSKEVGGEFHCYNNEDLEDISDLPEDVKELDIENCPKIKIFPKHIKDTLTLHRIDEDVLKRLKQQKHLEIIEIEEDIIYKTITIREKPLNEQFLDTV